MSRNKVEKYGVLDEEKSIQHTLGVVSQPRKAINV
jgi:hypothetical protein